MVLNSGSARISIVFRGSEGLHPSGCGLASLSGSLAVSPLCPQMPYAFVQFFRQAKRLRLSFV